MLHNFGKMLHLSLILFTHTMSPILTIFSMLHIVVNELIIQRWFTCRNDKQFSPTHRGEL